MTTDHDGIIFRKLTLPETEKIRAIDRSEQIDETYVYAEGQLELVPRPETVSGFEPGELDAIIARQKETLTGGGMVTGAFERERLIGVASVVRSRIGPAQRFCKMDILYVSKDFRNRQLGQRLLEHCKTAGRAFGAVSLYISATPTRNTVDFYLRQGAALLAEPDPVLYALEPEDIHMELIL